MIWLIKCNKNCLWIHLIYFKHTHTHMPLARKIPYFLFYFKFGESGQNHHQQEDSNCNVYRIPTIWQHCRHICWELRLSSYNIQKSTRSLNMKKKKKKMNKTSSKSWEPQTCMLGLMVRIPTPSQDVWLTFSSASSLATSLSSTRTSSLTLGSLQVQPVNLLETMHDLMQSLEASQSIDF